MKKQHIDLVIQYWAPWMNKTTTNRREYFRIENVPPQVVRKLMTGYPNARKMDKQNKSPTLTTMVKICEKYNGTLEGYVIPVESGRSDARILFDAFKLNVSDAIAKKIKIELSKRGNQRVGGQTPDEFDKVTGGWRFWWD